jgi:hypothetical protein
MHRLAAFRLAADGVVGELPTAAPRPDSPSGTTASLFGAAAAPIPLGPGRWLFDGSRLGQYLGGIDPRNSPSRLQRMLRWQRGTLITPNGFINESTDDDPSRYGYAVTRHAGLTVPVLIAHGEQFPIATLHVHSKKLRRFTSPALERYLRS